MTRYTRPLCKKCRREGEKLFLKGEKCSLPKCPVVRKNYKPGMHGLISKKTSEYGMQLREKQKAKRIYGVLEKQFKKYFQKASREKGNRGEILMQLLERRIDNVIYRAGITTGRREARNFITQNHFLLNGKKINIPSYLVKEKDTITIKKKSQKITSLASALSKLSNQNVPTWLKIDAKKYEISILTLPKREEIDTPINEQLIIEFYSR